MKNRFLLLSLALTFSAVIFATVESSAPKDYYAGADGKSGNELRLALRAAIDHHSNITYGNLGFIMKYADTKNADGETLIDLYSDCQYSTTTTNNKGQHDVDDYKVNWISGGSVGEGLNREHTVPQSWFDKKDPMVADAFHIYPTDAKCNNHRSSYLYGEIYPANSGETLSANGYTELGALGNTYKDNTDVVASQYSYGGKDYTLVPYTGTVYEPADEYKGDLARGIFYMATRYAGPETNDGTDCSTWKKGSNPTHFAPDAEGGVMGLSPYSVALFLKWHREDPVSAKELLRNEVIYGNPTYNPSQYKQGNRNPFIDYPELVEYLWGNKAGQTVTLSNLTSAYTNQGGGGGGGGGGQQEEDDKPIIIAPAYLEFKTEQYIEDTKEAVISFKNLTVAPTIELSGTDAQYFTLYVFENGFYEEKDTKKVTLSETSGAQSIKIEYRYDDSDATIAHNAKLVISSGTLTKTIELKAICGIVHTIEWYSDGVLLGTEMVFNNSKVSAIPANPAVPDGCAGEKVFVGWSQREIADEEDSEPIDLFTSLATSPTFYNKYYDIIYDIHAVFAKKTTSGGTESTETLDCSKLSFSDQEVITGKNIAIGSNTSVTFTKGSSTDTKYFTAGHIRWYSGASCTISSSSGNISKIVFTMTNTSNAVTVEAGGGEYSNKTWTGDAESVTFKQGGNSGHYRITKIEVTLSAGGTTTISKYTTRCGTYHKVTFLYGPDSYYDYNRDFRDGVMPSFVGTPYPYETDEYEYEFSHWEPAIAPVSKDQTYTAVYDANKRYYEVRYELDGMLSGLQPLAPRLVAYGEKVPKPDDPEPACHYHFDKWYSDLYNNVEYDFNTTVTDNMTPNVIGKMVMDENIVIPYVVELARMYHNETIYWNDTLKATGVQEGDMEFDLNLPDVDGYTKPSTTSWMLDWCEDTILITSLFYEPNQHKMKWVTDGDPLTGIINFDNDNLYYGYGSSYPAPNTPTKEGYVFAGWSPAKYEWMPDNDVTHTATFVPAQTLTIETYDGPGGAKDNDLLIGLNIQFDAAGAYSWNASSGFGLFEKGKHVKVTIDAAPGYIFYGIDDNASTVHAIEFDMPSSEEKSIKVYVSQSTTTYTIKIETNNDALGSVDLTGAIYIDASNFTDDNKWTFNAEPLPNIDFVAWICPALLNNGKTEQDLIDELDDEQVKWMSYWYDGIHPDEQVQLMMDLFNTLRYQTIYNLTGTNLLELIKAGLLVPNDNDELVLRAVFRDPNATAIEMSNTKCQMPNKIIRDNRLLILLPNGKTYNATGQRLK